MTEKDTTKITKARNAETGARVKPMCDGGYVVAGTLDIDLAQLAVAGHRLDELAQNSAVGISVDEIAREEAAHLPTVAYVGWMRWNPCSENNCEDGGGHTGHLALRSGPGRGNFLGVYLDDESRYDEDGIDPEYPDQPVQTAVDRASQALAQLRDRHQPSTHDHHDDDLQDDLFSCQPSTADEAAHVDERSRS